MQNLHLLRTLRFGCVSQLRVASRWRFQPFYFLQRSGAPDTTRFTIAQLQDRRLISERHHKTGRTFACSHGNRRKTARRQHSRRHQTAWKWLRFLTGIDVWSESPSCTHTTLFPLVESPPLVVFCSELQQSVHQHGCCSLVLDHFKYATKTAVQYIRKLKVLTLWDDKMEDTRGTEWTTTGENFSTGPTERSGSALSSSAWSTLTVRCELAGVWEDSSSVVATAANSLIHPSKSNPLLPHVLVLS